MFVAVVEAHSFTGAAVKLGTSSGQASQLVSRLEAELGVRLLTGPRVPCPRRSRPRLLRARPLHPGRDRQPRPCDQERGANPARPVTSHGSLTFGTVRARSRAQRLRLELSEIELEVSFSDRLVNLVDEGFDVAVRVGARRHESDRQEALRRRIVLVGSEPISPRMVSRRRPRICSAMHASSTRTFGSRSLAVSERGRRRPSQSR